MNQGTSMEESRRIAPRVSTQSVATLVRNGIQIAIRLIDISSTGLSAEIDELHPPKPGLRLFVYLRGLGPQSATVRWVRSGRIGLRFDYPIDVKRFEHE